MTIESPSSSQPPDDEGRRARARRIAVMSLAIVVLAAAGALTFALGRTAPASPGSPRAHLERALLVTKSAGTADMKMEIHADVGGFSVSATATGSLDFATNAASLQVHVLGQTVTLVESGQVLYVKYPKMLGSGPAGRTWVRIPVTAIVNTPGSQFFATTDPQAAMAALVRLGATVTPTGTTTIDGTQDQGYAIHLTMSELAAHASELPPSLRSLFASSGAVPRTAELSATMYVDPSGQLQAAHLLVTANPTGREDKMSLDVSMSHFGSATVPPPPPATQTVTFQEAGGMGGIAMPFGLPSRMPAA